MRKLYIILLALTLSVVTLAAAVLPVAADPRDNQPVAWVSFSGSNNGLHSNAEWSQKASFDPMVISIAATRRANGTTDGHAFDRVLDPRSEDYFAVIDSHFSVRANGALVADVLLFSGPDEAGLRWYSWWQFVDAGEPGRAVDTFQIFIWAQAFPISSPPWFEFLPVGYPSPWPPTFTPGIILGAPKWYPFSGLTPVPIAPGNVQVHITDRYVP